MKRQFCDLNIQESSSYSDNFKNIKHLITLGYHIVALNRHYGSPKKEQGKSKDPNQKSSMERAKDYVKEVKTLHDRLKTDIELLRLNKVNSGTSDQDVEVPDKFKLLSRITLEIDELDQLVYLRNPSYRLIMTTFDLVAVQPKNKKVFMSLMEGKMAFDIVYFPMEDRTPFKLDRHQVGLGTSNGLVFEVNFVKAIKSQSLRKYIFGNAQNLVSKTKRGAGIIVSSGGECIMDFRAPPDVANLCNLFNLNGSSGLDAVSIVPRKTVVRALLRRETFKGAVKVEKIVEEDDRKSEGEPLAKKQRL